MKRDVKVNEKHEKKLCTPCTHLCRHQGALSSTVAHPVTVTACVEEIEGKPCWMLKKPMLTQRHRQ